MGEYRNKHIKLVRATLSNEPHIYSVGNQIDEIKYVYENAGDSIRGWIEIYKDYDLIKIISDKNIESIEFYKEV